MNDQKSLKDRVTKVTVDVGVKPVVSATRERAQKASRAAGSRLPATQQDVQRLTEQLDRIEAAVAALAERVEAAKPQAPRRVSREREDGGLRAPPRTPPG